MKVQFFIIIVDSDILIKKKNKKIGKNHYNNDFCNS